MEKKLGFGCMRLPMNGEEVNYEEFNQMIDYYMEHGFHYFDTAHGYLNGKSETAIRDCLASRYPRESFVLTDKLTFHYFEKREDIRPFFENQLKWTGVDYFDYYLMHALSRERIQKYEDCGAFEVAQELKQEGKIKHIGISFHDTADVLEEILKNHPEIEIVQIQFNYLDFNDANVQSKKLYEVCQKYEKPVLVMEPVKGGTLANLPDEAKTVLNQLGENKSEASYAIRFAASFDGVFKVLSGMSSLEQMKDNVSYMEEFEPLKDEEYAAIASIVETMKKLGGIPCTACRYCTEGCPMNIAIPDLFSCYNAKKQFDDWNAKFYYSIHTKTNAPASACIKCGQCENACPQKLEIRALLEKVAKEFE